MLEDEIPEDQSEFLEINAELCEQWPNISEMKDALPDAEEWADVKGKNSIWNANIAIRLFSITWKALHSSTHW